MTTTTAAPAASVRTTTTHAGRFVHYTVQSVLTVLRDWSFLAFIVAMPTTMYLFFAAIYGDLTTEGGPSVAAAMMVTMATYGGLGAAMSAGAQIQSERSSGWFRQLMLTALTPTQFIGAKILTAVVVVLPGIGVVFGAGAVRGVRMEPAVWLGSFTLLVASLLPMVMLGLVLGLWFKPQTAGAATTLAMLALSMIGGLWFPLDMMPAWMQPIGRAMPSYWASQIGTWPLVSHQPFPWEGVGVIAAWTVALVVIGALGYRRAIRTSRR
ncbi:MAG: ABC transporter permease [Propioniciclava sp.]|uniref:ABC transporter permease n=1 Tax=Propioniciclava sp. TaxID=2038686 RepID=UPI0039E65152